MFLCCFAYLQWIPVATFCFISVFWEICLIHCCQLRCFLNWLLTSDFLLVYTMMSVSMDALFSPFTLDAFSPLSLQPLCSCPLVKSLSMHIWGCKAAFWGSFFKLGFSVPWKGCVTAHFHEEGGCSHVPAAVKLLASCCQKRFTVIMPLQLPHHYGMVACL